MKDNESLAVPLLRDISTAIARERNVGKLLPQVLEIAEKRLGMVRGTIALARDGGGDVAQQRHGEGFVVFHGARILAVPSRARKHFLTKMERFDRN